jgi:hypothetical protein
MMGVEPTDISAHKRLLAVLEGGFLPAISLFFMHLLMKIEEMGHNEGDKKEVVQEKVEPEVFPMSVVNENKESVEPQPLVENDVIQKELVEESVEQKDEAYIMTQKDLEEILDKTDAELDELIESVQDIEEPKQEEVEQPQEEVKVSKPNRLHYTK